MVTLKRLLIREVIYSGILSHFPYDGYQAAICLMKRPLA